MDYRDTMKFMAITIWVHHMQLDEMFDFLSGRIDTPPPYWYNHEECPYTATGGYAAVAIPYGEFSKLRSIQDWADPFSIYNPIEEANNWSRWDDAVGDNGFDDHADFVDLD